jgi:ATP/maltotriose-dependent transcriptional regulator MalT
MTQHKEDKPDMRFASLTPREWEVLTLLLDAYTNSEISEKMGVTLQTVKYHIGNIYGKLNVKNRAQCLKLAQEYSTWK